MARLLGIGSALLDLLAHVPEEFLARVPGRKGGTELVDRDQSAALIAALPSPPARAPGGSAANTLTAAARLGLPAAMLAKIGDDEAGRFYRAALENTGVDTSRFKVQPGEATGSCVSLITPDSQRTMRTYLGAAAFLDPADLRPEDFAGCELLHLEGYQLFNRELVAAILQHAKNAGLRVSLDLSAPEVIEAARDILPGILADSVDIVLANEDEAAAFARTRDETAALEALHQHCDIAVLKLGPRGVRIRSNAGEIAVPAQPVERPVDTTGAGDLWAGGFLYGILAGAGLAAAARIGVLLGAAVVQITGAWLPESQWKNLRRRAAEILAAHPET